MSIHAGDHDRTCWCPRSKPASDAVYAHVMILWKSTTANGSDDFRKMACNHLAVFLKTEVLAFANLTRKAPDSCVPFPRRHRPCPGLVVFFP